MTSEGFWITVVTAVIAALVAGFIWFVISQVPHRYAGDTRKEAYEVAVSALANKCGPEAADEVISKGTKGSYAGRDAWLFHTSKDSEIWVWYDDEERNKDFSVVSSACNA